MSTTFSEFRLDVLIKHGFSMEMLVDHDILLVRPRAPSYFASHMDKKASWQSPNSYLYRRVAVGSSQL
jgi:hypothetical protein